MTSNRASSLALLTLLLASFGGEAKASSITYTFTSLDVVNAFSSTYSSTWNGTGWLGTYNANGTGGNGRPAPFNGGSAIFQTNSAKGAGVVDLFMRPDDLTTGTQVTYSVAGQTSSQSSLYALGTSGTSGASTKLLPNYGSSTAFNTTAGSPTLVAASDSRMFAEFGDVTGGSRYLMLSKSMGTNPTVYNSAGGTPTVADLALPDSTTFSVTLTGSDLNPGMQKFVFFLWGDSFSFLSSQWRETSSKNIYLGSVALDLNGQAAVPEPSSFVILGSGLALLALRARRRNG